MTRKLNRHQRRHLEVISKRKSVATREKRPVASKFMVGSQLLPATPLTADQAEKQRQFEERFKALPVNHQLLQRGRAARQVQLRSTNEQAHSDRQRAQLLALRAGIDSLIILGNDDAAQTLWETYLGYYSAMGGVLPPIFTPLPSAPGLPSQSVLRIIGIAIICVAVDIKSIGLKPSQTAGARRQVVEDLAAELRSSQLMDDAFGSKERERENSSGPFERWSNQLQRYRKQLKDGRTLGVQQAGVPEFDVILYQTESEALSARMADGAFTGQSQNSVYDGYIRKAAEYLKQGICRPN